MFCSLAEGDIARAAGEAARIRRDHPDATGDLAGKQGVLADIADALVEEARTWRIPEQTPQAGTFAFNVARNQTLARPVDVGAELWSVQFSPRERSRFRFASRQPAFDIQPALSVHPVVHGDLVLLNDSDRIYTWNLKTGRPAWPGPAGDEDDAVIYQMRSNLLPVDARPAIGVPRFSMTVHDGRLYARMGPPVTSRSEEQLFVDFESALVVLDLDPETGQGKLLTKVTADALGRGGPPWSFEGSPLVAGGRMYAAVRRSQPQMQFNVACFDVETGRLIWNRKVCAAVSNIGRTSNLISHQLLTLAEETLFLSTDLGAIAALDVHDGVPLWVVTYESRPSESPAELSDHTRQGLLPCLYHGGTIYASPNDSDRLFALDAHSGVVTWQRRLNDNIRHLLGVGRGNLIVSGNSLWGLDAGTGDVAWGREITDPEAYGYGRGLLVGDAVWWPTRETIEVRSQRTGFRVHRQPIPLAAHGITPARNTGGNLLLADGHLLVAQPDRLVVYGEYPAPAVPATEISSLRP
jgi:outer membrane protein assembly factor BamB